MKLIATLLVLVGIVLTGCNTVAGVGKDIERAGGAIQKSTK